MRTGRMLGALVALGLAAAADPPEWTQPIAPCHLIGPIDYVGSKGIAAYLIHTTKGAILIDGTLEANAAMVEHNIEAMGVPIRDVKLILVSHAHFDHVGAIAALEARSGAKVAAGAYDREALETGVPPGETLYTPVRFPKVRVDIGVGNGGKVRLGDAALTPWSTPGHTPGCTTWAMRIVEKGRPLSVVFPCSLTVAGNRLVGNRRYPGIVSDFRSSFARMAAMKADVVLPAHPEIADVQGRAARGDLVDPALLPRIVEEQRRAFETELARQQQRQGSTDAVRP